MIVRAPARARRPGGAGSRLGPRLGTGTGRWCGPASQGHLNAQPPKANAQPGPWWPPESVQWREAAPGGDGPASGAPGCRPRKRTRPRSDPETPPGLLPGTWGSQPPRSTAPAPCRHPAPFPRGPGDEPAPLQSRFSSKTRGPSAPASGHLLRPGAEASRRPLHAELQTDSKAESPSVSSQGQQRAQGTQASREEGAGAGRAGRRAELGLACPTAPGGPERPRAGVADSPPGTLR